MRRQLPPDIDRRFADLFAEFRDSVDRRLPPEDVAERFGLAARLYALDWFDESPKSPVPCSQRRQGG